MIVLNNPDYARRIAEAAGVALNPSIDPCIANEIDGELAGGVIYNTYTGRGGSICIHVAGFRPDWISKQMLRAAFHYPFVQLECKKLIGQVPSYNAKALEFDAKLGFKLETIVRDVFADGDLYVLSMYREDCRYLKR